MKPSPVDLLFRAFADGTRLRILHLLSARTELCVCDIRAVLGQPQPTVSRHLSYLRRAGLVEDRKQGLWRHYRLSTPSGRVHKRLVGCLAQCFAEVPALRQDAAALKRLKSGAPPCP